MAANMQVSMAEAKAVAAPSNEPNKGLAGMAQWPEKIKSYYEDLRAEMRRVTWPSRLQVQATTAVVLAAIFLFAAYFALVDMLFGQAITQLFQALTRR
jgi:preprotein translocase subunit SecE